MVPEERMRVVDRDEGAAWWVAGSLMQVKATGADTHNGLTLIEQTCPPGLDSPAHVHPDEEQCLYMLDGTIEVTCGDATRAIGPGAFVVMPRGVPHSFVVTGEHGARFLSITSPSGFERLVQEIGVPAPALTPPPVEDVSADVVSRSAALGYDLTDQSPASPSS
jgi:quercetin dioxygenase-like cupin family protein